MNRNDLFAGFTPAAHRGASRQYPENTLEAFRRSLEIMPLCMLELDVRKTLDGRAVVFHDPSLDPKTDGSGPVHDSTLSEIKMLDAGYGITFDNGATYPFRDKGFRIATLEEILQTFPGARMSVDIKDNDLNAAALAMSIINEHKAGDRVIIASFFTRVVRFVRKKYPNSITSFSKRDIFVFYLLHKLGLAGLFSNPGAAMFVPEFAGAGISEYQEESLYKGFRVVSPGFIRDAHQQGIPVLVWTINRAENMRRLISWGADGIITDYPDLLKQVMEDRGLL
jgi:glycerophosphoryl diester phosphodiesterase